MRPAKLYVPQDLGELLDELIWMSLNSPKFEDKLGYFPGQNIGAVFEALNAGLAVNRPQLGEERYDRLAKLSEKIRACFEADPDNSNGEARRGKEMIYEMEDIISTVPKVT